jgi:hypothetical protein
MKFQRKIGTREVQGQKLLYVMHVAGWQSIMGEEKSNTN